MQVRPKTYTYHTALRWTEQRKGTTACVGKPDIQVATPPEFKGHEGIWSPEDLFVASVEVCTMTTFLAFAERSGLSLVSYQSEAEGRLESVDGTLQFTTITVRPRIIVRSETDYGKANEVLQKTESACLIANSMKAKVLIDPAVSV